MTAPAPNGTEDQGWSGDRWGLLVLPALLFMLVLFVLPLVWVLVRSVTVTAPGAPWYSNYIHFFRTGVYSEILLRTCLTSLLVTTVCLAVGYPLAYVMNSASPRVRGILLAAVLVPLWSSVLVRTWGWTVLLQDTGVVNRILLSLGLVARPVGLMRNTVGVTIGMTQVLLPVMALPLFATMRRIDPEHVLAAAGLGGPPWKTFVRVFLPLTRPGILTGSILVFVLALGFYITPALLGSPGNTMLSEQILKLLGPARDPGLATASAGVLLAVTGILLVVAGRLFRFSEALGIRRT